MASTHESSPGLPRPRTHEDGVRIGGIAVPEGAGLSEKELKELRMLAEILEQNPLGDPSDTAEGDPASDSSGADEDTPGPGYIRVGY